MSAISLYRPRFVPVRSAARAARPVERPVPRLRITARGRAVVATLLAVPIAFGAVAVGVGQQAAAQSAPVPASFDYVTVQPGQSLWSIADDVAPASDPREVVARIVDLNQLPSAELQAGQRLAVPSAR